MKWSNLMAACVLLTACAVLGAADDKANDKAKLFQQYSEKFGPPGPEHKFLEPLAGNWQARCRMWFDPAQSPQESDGTLNRKFIFDGRFIQEDYSGQMMGKPFHGLGTMGYDRAKKRWCAYWIDSVSTAMHLSHGTYDDAAKTWTFKHEDDCPITGERVKMRDTLRIVSPDQQIMEMYRQMGSEKESKMMEITLTRKQ